MRSISKVLVILALVLRGLVPAGLMLAPAPAASGEMTVVICTGHGPMTVTLDADGQPVPAKRALDHKSVCAFKVAASTALAASHAGLSSPADFGEFRPLPPSRDPILRDRQAVLPPARGPPQAS